MISFCLRGIVAGRICYTMEHMDSISYKEFSEEEDRIYRNCIGIVTSNISNGVKFDLACKLITLENNELKAVIIADALKIEIAELHYGRRLPLNEISKKLGVSMERLLRANNEMVEDVMHTANEGARDASVSKKPTVD